MKLRPTQKITRRFTKCNWVALMIVNISELEKGNGVHGVQNVHGAWKPKYYNGIS